MESKLKGKLDDCFLRRNFNQLSMATVYRIIEKNQEEQISSDLLYEFICKLKEERLPLLSFIDIQNLSDSKFEKLFDDYSKSDESMKKQYSLYLPCDLVLIHQMKEEKKSILMHIKEIEKVNNQIQCDFDRISIENNQHQKQIEKMTQDQKDILIKLDQLMKENDELKQAKENQESENHARLSNESEQTEFVKSFLKQFKDLNEVRLKGIYQ